MQNGGFENYTDVYGGDNINRATNWYSMFNSPDLLHSQIGAPIYSTYPHTGNGCAGLGLSNVMNSEYFYGKTEELSPIAKYILTFYVKRNYINSIPLGVKVVNTQPPTNPYSTTGVGNLNYVTDYLSNPNNSPDIIFESINNEYQKVSYCFTPTVYGVHYIIFGTFLSEMPSNSAQGNFFYIDDVELSYATNEQQNVESNLVLTSTALCTQNTLLIDGTSSQFETEHQWEIFKFVNNQPTLVYSGNNEQGNAGVFNVTTAFSSVGYQPLPGDCYRVKLKVVNGCTDIDQLDFCYEDLNVDFLNVPAAVCEGSPTDISVTGDDNWTYTWSNGDSGEGMKTTLVIPVFPSSQYTVMVTSPSGCSQVNTITLNVHSNNNLAPWMNGIQNLSNGTLGSDPYTVYINSGSSQILSFNSIINNDHINEFLITSSNSSDFPLTDNPYINVDNNQLIFVLFQGGFTPSIPPGEYQFLVNVSDQNVCNEGVLNQVFTIKILCPTCPIECVEFENRTTSTIPLPPETKAGICIEAGLTQPVNTGTANVLFQAGESITLGNFFTAGPGFEALIEPTSCVDDCEECCDDFAGFTYDEIPNGTYLNFSDDDPTNDIFQITDINHPFCAYGAKSFDLYIYPAFGSGTIYELTNQSNNCCNYESTAPENPIAHSSIYWDGYVNNIFGNPVHALDGNYIYQLRLYGCNGAYEEIHGFIQILSSSGLIPIPNNIDNLSENKKNELTSTIKETNKLFETISLAPNPAINEVQIFGLIEGKSVKAQLFDSKGVIIDKELQIKSGYFDVSKLVPGKYYCKLLINGHYLTKSFIKI